MVFLLVCMFLWDPKAYRLQIRISIERYSGAAGEFRRRPQVNSKVRKSGGPSGRAIRAEVHRSKPSGQGKSAPRSKPRLGFPVIGW